MPLVEFGAERRSQNGHAPSDFPTPINPKDWLGLPVPKRRWVVHEVIPALNVTLLSGDGAIGKSTLMMQLAGQVAMQRQDWVGYVIDHEPDEPQRGAMYLGAEDDIDEIHRRLDRIVHSQSVDFDALEHLQVWSLAGKDAVLGHANRLGLVRPTPLYQHLLGVVMREKPKLIALDTAADVFAGNENDRGQVRQFVGLLRALAIAADGAVMLASHPSLTGMQSDSGLSGSTAWHNSVRSRLYLKTAANGSEKAARILEVKKSNYGPVPASVVLEWIDGVLKPVGTPSDYERQAIDDRVDQVFLALLVRFGREGRNVSDTSGRSYAPALFATESEAIDKNISKTELVASMKRLFAKEKIHVESYGKASNPHRRLAPRELGI